MRKTLVLAAVILGSSFALAQTPSTGRIVTPDGWRSPTRSARLVGLWAGNGSGGEFSNLKLTPAP